jgi:hypothetical protein
MGIEFAGAVASGEESALIRVDFNLVSVKIMITDPP